MPANGSQRDLVKRRGETVTVGVRKWVDVEVAQLGDPSTRVRGVNSEIQREYGLITGS